MKVTNQMVDNLANLSRLEFSETEKEKLKKDLESVIGMMDKLNGLNTDNVEPLLHMTPELNALRDDMIKGTVSREEALKNAPVNDDQFFKVPKVIRK